MRYCVVMGNSLPNDNILDLTEFKASVDDNFYVVQIMIYVFDGIEKHCWRRRKYWLSAFSPLLIFFKVIKQDSEVIC